MGCLPFMNQISFAQGLGDKLANQSTGKLPLLLISDDISRPKESQFFIIKLQHTAFHRLIS